MQISKWGNSLAIRLPSALIKALSLKEGDEIEIEIAGQKRFRVRRDGSRDKALKRLKSLASPLPKGFRFDRGDANER